jgi:phosphinothricin acetyltransferase
MEIKLDLTRLKTPKRIRYHQLLNSTALYDYNIKSYEQQDNLDDKINKRFPVIVAELDVVVWFWNVQ